MDEQSNYVELVEQARRGDRDSAGRLAEMARERLRVYVYRLTLQEDLTQEIVQETMLEMYKIFGKLKRADRFWPWLYGIAVNKIHRHQRTERTQKRLAMGKAERLGPMRERQEGFEHMVGQELKQVVAKAMGKLKTRHKAVLVMRCYDDMSYAEIAESMRCSEFSTRMLFMRAKRSLQRELTRNGFGKGSLLAALVLFGKMTASSEAAAAEVTVTAAATRVGLAASLLGLLTSKPAVVSLTAAGVIGVGSAVISTMPERSTTGGVREQHNGSEAAGMLGQGASGNEEFWYYFPEGADGPVMMRVQSGPGGRQGHCRLLQNDRRCYEQQGGVIYVNNHRAYAEDLSVVRLPTDSPQLSAFLSEIDGGRGQMQYVPARQEGLLVVATRNPERGGDCAWVTRHSNVLDEDFFQPDWPTGIEIVDDRDEMHTRGWTYFRVSGRAGGNRVTGTGRVPFVYAASRLYGPWLRLRVGQDLEINDGREGASLSIGGRQAGWRYPRGAFFAGLGRPWMGLHAVDTVRRDAAERGVRFETRRIEGGKVRVELAWEDIRLNYVIDLERDLVDEIAFAGREGIEGELQFSYLEDVDNVGGEFVEPGRGAGRRVSREPMGISWLASLAQGSLGK